MKLFRYLDERKGIAETYAIYKAVQNLKPYAISKYKSLWEDALDEAFFHILENFDSSKGDLDNYATKIVGTILLNRNRKEVADNDKTLLTLDLKEAEEYEIPENVAVEEEKSRNLKDCIIDMIPFFVNDFKLFVGSNSKDRKLNYSELFSKYTYKTISEAKDYLSERYADDMSRLMSFTKNITLKKFSDDRYLKSEETGLEYRGVLNDIIIVKRGKGSHSKKLFKLCITRNVDDLISLFYNDGCCGKVVIEGRDVYLSISGNIVMGEELLRSYLERELIGSVLSRTALKVVNYTKGSEIIFSSTRDFQPDVILPMFGKDVSISFERVVSKEVS